jgi:hypothetical protein
MIGFYYDPNAHGKRSLLQVVVTDESENVCLIDFYGATERQYRHCEVHQ